MLNLFTMAVRPGFTAPSRWTIPAALALGAWLALPAAAMEATIPLGGEDSPVTSLLLMLLCLVAVSFFSSSEASLLSVSKIRIRHLAEGGHKGARAVARLVKDHDKLFATVLTVENAFIILASSLGTVLVLKLFGESYLVAGSLVMTVVIVIFSEITPKTYAAQNAERVALLVARPMELVMRVSWWAILPFTAAAGVLLRLMGSKNEHKSPFASEDEIKMMIEIGRQEGMLPEEQSEILENVFDLGATKVSQAMIPRTRIAALEEEATLRTALEHLESGDFTRYPVYKENIDHVAGVVNLRDIALAVAKGERQLDDPITPYVRPVPFVPETKLLTDMLKDFQEGRYRMAIVADEYGGTSGLITLEDVLEEIVGGMMHDAVTMEDAIQLLRDGRAIMPGHVEIEEVEEKLDISFPRGDYNTIAGFLMASLEEIPRVGEAVRHGGYEFRVTGRIGPRITQVLAVVLSPAAEDQPPAASPPSPPNDQ